MSKAEDKARSGSDPEQLRPARMRIETTVLMSRGDESHPTELVEFPRLACCCAARWAGTASRDKAGSST
ncbi:hypothetical protein SAMN04487785_102288 [Dyella jiangningensis]|nr:hypothetical protein BDW41_102288 [Dyella sp. AtDHG13]SDJ50513.1 hypothetical protein SAMN04487785_102288 [Dyella jiangningensis]